MRVVLDVFDWLLVAFVMIGAVPMLAAAYQYLLVTVHFRRNHYRECAPYFPRTAILVRLAYGVGVVAAFALGSIGAFLPFRWPPLLRDIVLSYLLAFLALRIALALARFVLAPPERRRPEVNRFRILLVSDRAARFPRWRVPFASSWGAQSDRAGSTCRGSIGSTGSRWCGGSWRRRRSAARSTRPRRTR